MSGFAAIAAPSPADVNEKVLKAFKEAFSAAQDVSWQEYDEYYQANFHQDDIQVRVQYDDNGKLHKDYQVLYGKATDAEYSC